MHTITKLKIDCSPLDVYQAFIDPAKIKNFWFSSSSAIFEEGKTIRLTYDEYSYQGEMTVIELIPNQKIKLDWEGYEVTIWLTGLGNGTIVEAIEEGFDEQAEDIIDQLVDNKEGWIYMLTCLKAYLEFGISTLRANLVK